MLTLLLGTDWTANRAEILRLIANDVACQKGNRVLMVPELISHDTERRLCAAAGDTSSRFVEVLSFTRLARRVAESVGHAVPECLDNGGRLVAMASAARNLSSKLKAYAAVETRPEFLMGLLDAVDEFKRCCISSEDLKIASGQLEGNFAQKLEELALLMEGYDALCAQGKRDPRDQMTWMLEELESGDFAQNHVFYIDGFPDFTRQHMAVLAHLIECSEHVIVSLNCDTLDTTALAFEKAGATASELVKIAKKHGVPVNIQNVNQRSGSLRPIREKLFHGEISETVSGNVLRTYRTDTVYQECVAAAEQILQHVCNGVRYRQISVVCADPAYLKTVETVFNRCHIPTYLSGTEDILNRTVMTTVLSALEAALGGFERQDVMTYLKSVLSPLNVEITDKIENYAILWDINGKNWLQEWKKHPAGLSKQWTDGYQLQLDQLNKAREFAMDPLKKLADDFRNAQNLSEQVRAVYVFLERIDLVTRMDKLAKELDVSGDNRSAQIINQLWDILLQAMEQLHDVLGQTAWDTETFTRLFKLLLSQYDVGTIPPVLDAVTVGPVSAMRCQECSHLFVLGASEGNLPGYSGSVGVLTDYERTKLRAMGIPLTGGAIDGLAAEFAEIYGVFCSADETVTVSCSQGQPSFVYQRLSQLSDCDDHVVPELGAAMGDAFEAGAYLARWNASAAAEGLGVTDAYRAVCAKKEHEFGSISSENIQKLYGSKLNLSASQVDKQADCRMSYFLKYGLRAQERKTASVDPAEFGTYVHAVLEETAKQIMDEGGFAEVSMDRALEIARFYSDKYANEHFSQLDTQRIRYLFQRNAQELELIVMELWRELHDSKFVPVGFEIGFGDHEEMPAIPVSGTKMQAQLRGFVDRVDIWKSAQQTYLRVVDYKTGKKEFDYCDVFNGLGLQMLLYLFALEQAGEQLVGQFPIPAGVQYFPARVPLVSADGTLTDEQAAAEREKLWKRKGLLLSDEDVLSAMEPDETSKRMPYSKKKDGSLSGDIASRRQFELLKAYVFGLLGKMVDDIASGCVEPNPYTRGSSHDACAFCPYGSICHAETVEGRRNYKAMNAQRFWDEVEKEVADRGREIDRATAAGDN